VRSFLISWLAKRSEGTTLEAFSAERPEQWLVWEAGPWRPTYQNRETLEASGERGRPPHGAGESLAIALEQGPRRPYVTLGRGPDNDLVIDDATLSRLHLIFSREAEGWSVRDAGSTNGASVDGLPLGPDAVVLQTGSLVVAGSVRLTYYDAGGLWLRLRTGR
jgi:hypothetical protein